MSVLSAVSMATSVPVPMADPASFILQSAGLGDLVFGQDRGEYTGDTDLAGDRGGGVAVELAVPTSSVCTGGG
jgi:hypothetical protein